MTQTDNQLKFQLTKVFPKVYPVQRAEKYFVCVMDNQLFKKAANDTSITSCPTTTARCPKLDESEKYALAVLWKIIGRDYNETSLLQIIKNTESRRQKKKTPPWKTGFSVLEFSKDLSMKFAISWIPVIFKMEKGFLNVYLKRSNQRSTHKGPFPITEDFAQKAFSECPYLRKQLVIWPAAQN